MRYLIDGYNLMYAGGLLGKKLKPDGFRQIRHRFLNDLAHALGLIDASETTVVFDAASAIEGVSKSSGHKGLSVIYAVDNESADERIEQLIQAHSSPRRLTVVSSDRRIRQAATRRKARATTADDFLTELDARKHRRSQESRSPSPPSSPPPSGDRPASSPDAEFWLAEFADLASEPETREALNGPQPLLTDEEIAELEREIDREFP